MTTKIHYLYFCTGLFDVSAGWITDLERHLVPLLKQLPQFVRGQPKFGESTFIVRVSINGEPAPDYWNAILNAASRHDFVSVLPPTRGNTLWENLPATLAEWTR